MQSYGNIMANNEIKDTNPKSAAGVKKVPMSVIPTPVLSEVAVALFEGDAKYGRYNYRVSGARASVYYDALLRHIFAWWEGEDIDPASGIHHVTKAISGLIVLRDCIMRGVFNDDRPPFSESNAVELEATMADIVERYKHLNPKAVTQKNFVDSYLQTPDNKEQGPEIPELDWHTSPIKHLKE